MFQAWLTSTDDGGTEAAFGDPVNGAALYQGSCQACHGPDGTGIEGLGKSWVGSDYINTSSDAELVEFLKSAVRRMTLSTPRGSRCCRTVATRA